MPMPGQQAPTARLSIRAAVADARSSAGVHALLGRLRVRWGQAFHRPEKVAAVIDIRDLQGRRVLEIGAARPPLDLELPAGTYHVSIAAGGQRRLYTIVLEPDACFELPLHAPARELAT